MPRPDRPLTWRDAAPWVAVLGLLAAFWLASRWTSWWTWLVSLANAILYEATFQLWRAAGEFDDDPGWRENWAMRTPEECMAGVVRSVAQM
jgi:hypothetical protein